MLGLVNFKKICDKRTKGLVHLQEDFFSMPASKKMVQEGFNKGRHWKRAT